MIRLTPTVVLALCLLACTPTPAAPTYAVGGHALAGPTCPVQPASPAPGQCAPRPVAGAILVIADAGGHEIVRLSTASDGRFSTQLPAGSYTLAPQPVAGLMGTAPAISFTVSAAVAPAELRVEYDTGIR